MTFAHRDQRPGPARTGGFPSGLRVRAHGGRFTGLDSAGPQTKTALTSGTITIGLVLSSDAALAAG